MRIHFGRCLRVAQTKNRVTNVAVAAHFGVHHQQVMRWRKSASVKLDLADRIAQHFGMTLCEFLALDGHDGVE